MLLSDLQSRCPSDRPAVSRNKKWINFVSLFQPYPAAAPAGRGSGDQSSYTHQHLAARCVRIAASPRIERHTRRVSYDECHWHRHRHCHWRSGAARGTLLLPQAAAAAAKWGVEIIGRQRQRLPACAEANPGADTTTSDPPIPCMPVGVCV
jgi:hypothetical protein